MNVEQASVHMKSKQTKQLIQKIEANWLRQEIGFIYLDIVGFSEIEQVYGELVCTKILTSLERIFERLQKQDSSILHVERRGDDFFIYITMGKTALEHNEELVIKERATDIFYQVKKRLNEHMFEMKEVIDFHLGYTLLYQSPAQSIESIIYSATKRVIKQVKETHQQYYQETKTEFHTILTTKNLSTLYQPIVSLSLGEVFGFEALTRGPAYSYFHYPNQLFQFAEAESLLYELEKITRELAIKRTESFFEPYQKLFININSEVIYDPQFSKGYTLELLKEYGLKPQNIIFEITERNAIKDFSAFKRVLQHYKEQGFQIAIDDAGAGYSSLQAISELQPDYIKVDRSLIDGIDKNKVKEHLLETFVNIARKMNSKVIAEGIETVEELEKVTRLGVHFGQGYFLSKPKFPPSSISSVSLHSIEKNKRIFHLDMFSKLMIKGITSRVRSFDITEPVASVSQYFSESNGEMGAVIVDHSKPVGLVMKEKLNQELVKPYGVSLYWKKPIKMLMDDAPLIVEGTQEIDLVAQQAITREYQRMYDYVIVVERGKLLGIVSIQHILDFLTNVKMELVRHSNPLTGLPGNTQINQEINKRLASKQPFSLIYADINHFKWFNDRYGFQRGDLVIKYVADMLQEVILDMGHAADFIGHVGGDDFLIVTLAEPAKQIAEEIIKRFHQDISSFYDEDEKNVNPIDRDGNVIDTYGLSIALALIECQVPQGLTIEAISQISAEIKKKAKEKDSSQVIRFTCPGS